MQKENPLWSAQRIQGELGKLGFDICENTVAKYMLKTKTDPEKIQRWLTFLRNHAPYSYHLHDDDSQKTMMELAKSNSTDLAEDRFEDSLRTVGQSKTGKNTQVPEIKELMDVILADKNITERAGFDLPSFCNLMKTLYLTLKSSKDKDLSSLYSLLSQHGFLLP